MSINVSVCRACGHRVYPARLWCPACGHDKAGLVAADHAELQAWTVMPARDGQAPVIIATARVCSQGSPEGPVLVLRLEETPTHPGQGLRLYERHVQGQPLPWASIMPV